MQSRLLPARHGHNELVNLRSLGHVLNILELVLAKVIVSFVEQA